MCIGQEPRPNKYVERSSSGLAKCVCMEDLHEVSLPVLLSLDVKGTLAIVICVTLKCILMTVKSVQVFDQ